MNTKYRNLFTDTLIFAIGEMGSKLIMFLLVPLYTNCLTVEEYGVAELISTFSTLLIPVTTLSIASAVIRFGMMKDEKRENVAVASFVIICFSVIATVILVHVLGIYQPVQAYLGYLCIKVITSNISIVEKTYLKTKNRNRAYAVISISQTAVLALTNIVMLTFCRMGVDGYLTANVLSSLTGALLAFFCCNLYSDLRKGHFDSSLLRRMVSYSAPLIFSDVSWWILHSSDKIMIELMLSSSALGIYTVATKIPLLINVVTSIFNQAWAISAIKEVETSEESGFHNSVYRLFSTAIFGACIVLIILIEPFMNIYVGDSFKDAWVYTPLLLAAAVYYSLTTFLGSLYVAKKKSRNDMLTTLMCALINIIINYFGIRIMGIWGAVLGTFVAYFVCAFVRLFDIKRIMRFEIGISYWLNSAILIIQAVAVSLKWHPYLISSFVCIMFVAVNRKEIKLVLNKISKLPLIRK